MVQLSDYNGVRSRKWGANSRGRLERQDVHPRHYKRKQNCAPLRLKDKFHFVLQDSVDPVDSGQRLTRGLAQAAR